MCGFLGHVVMGSHPSPMHCPNLQVPGSFFLSCGLGFFGGFTVPAPGNFRHVDSFGSLSSPALRVLLPTEVAVYHLVLTNYYFCFFQLLGAIDCARSSWNSSLLAKNVYSRYPHRSSPVSEPSKWYSAGNGVTAQRLNY